MKVSDEITYNGRTLTIKEWAQETGISTQNILLRLSRGKEVEEALTTPVLQRPVYKTVAGKAIKVKKTDIEKRMSSSERAMFLSCFTTKNFGKFARRNEGICLFILNTGLRLAEFCSLKVYEVLSVNGSYKEVLDVRAEVAKRGKNRQIPLRKAAKAALDLLIDRNTFGLEDRICPLSQRQVREVVAQASIRAGLNRILSPHCLRHDFLSRLYFETKDVKTTQTIAGHSSSTTTMDIYVQSTWNDLEAGIDLVGIEPREETNICTQGTDKV